MGQRLNIEIKNNGELLANAYYHWSGYTSSSLELTQEIINSLDSVKYEDNVVKAIKLLEVTGSGLTSDEIEYGKNNIVEFVSYNFNSATSRNNGLTAITKKGMETTEYWEEARVEIDIFLKTIKFGAIWEYTKEKYTDEYEDYEDEDKFNDIPIHDIDLSNIPFDSFSKVKDLILELINNKVYKIRTNENIVYWFIE